MKLSTLAILAWLAVAAVTPAAAQPARNVILFLGDAGGLPTLNAAGLLAHDRPLSLYLHSMPNIALSDTSALNAWVSDSAAGMTAIVAGHKTNNGTLSMIPGAAGTFSPVKTLFEYAEERGLATGIVTNMPVWDATPAACYAHVPSRKNVKDIYAQFFAPRYGDGVDVLIGRGRKDFEKVRQPDQTLEQTFASHNYRFFDTPAAITSGARRVVSIHDGTDVDPIAIAQKVLEILGANERGYLLVFEWDMHPTNLQNGNDEARAALERAVQMDNTIRFVSERVGDDTLVLFTADHSFGLRLRGGKRSKPFAAQFADDDDLVPVGDYHTGEEVLVAARGPGAAAVKGFMPNAQLFDVVLQAYGWKKDGANQVGARGQESQIRPR